MAAGRLLVPGWSRALDSDGNPIAARVSLFTTGTDALAPVYSDQALSIPLMNPVQSNSAGRFPAIWASDAVTYDWSVEAPYGPPGTPFTGTGLTTALTADILIAEAAEAAAEDADEAAAAAAASAQEAEDTLEAIEAIIAGAPDAPSVLNKLDRDGSNAGVTFLDNITFSTSLAGAANRPLREKLEDQKSIMDFLDDSGNLIDGNFSVIDNALDAAYATSTPLFFPPGDYVVYREHAYLPEAITDIPPTPNPAAVGAFAPGLSIVGASMIGTRIHNRVPNGYVFKLDVTNPVPYAYRAEMGARFSNFTIIGLSSIAQSGGIEMFNVYQGQLDQLHLRNMSGTAIKMVNGLEGNVPDSGWNCISMRSIWIENCGTGGLGWGIDATGTEGRNEGSFTHLTNIFIQGCGRNQYFSITGISTANPAIMTVNLNQMPAVSPTQTQHPFAFGDRVKAFGVKKTQAMAADPLATTVGSAVVTVTLAAHGLAVGDMISLSGVAAVGGITPAGVYMISSVPTTGTFTFIHATAATSTVAAGGGGGITLISPMKAIDDVDYYVGPTVSATTIPLFVASGARVSLISNPFATTNGSPTVTVTRTGHGLVVGDFVTVAFATAFNGLTIDKGYTVASVPDANTFTITASSNATATGSGGGTVAKYQKIVSFNGATIGTWVSDLAAPVTLANNPITTTLTAPTTVTITHTAHGAVAGDLVTIAGATAVGGVTVDGQYRIVNVPNANSYTITVSPAASAAATGGGAAVTVQYTYRTTVQGEVGFYEPQSGGLRSKSQLFKLNSCGFTLNHNCAQYLQGGAGGAIGLYCEQVTWENNYRRHFFAKGGINFLFMGNQVHGNNQAGLRQWRLFEFDASEYVIQQVLFQNNKIRAKECPSIAFKYSGAQSSPNNIRVYGTLWADYDYTGQQRYNNVPMDQINQDLILTYSSTTAMILRPDQFAGGGNKTPLRLRGPNNDAGTGVPSITGEWIEWQLTSNNGLSLSNAGLANSTLYYVYGYDNDGVMALTASTLAPVVEVSHGYQVLPGDPTMLFVGEAQTDGAGLFTTTGQGFLQVRRIGGNQAGSAAYEWDDWVLGRTLKRNGARPTSATQATGIMPWSLFASKSHNFGNIVAGGTETTTLTTGVTAALGDIVRAVALSIDQQGITLTGWVSAANTITVVAKNETAGAIDLVNATLSVEYVRQS